jgi:hypothetical protein
MSIRIEISVKALREEDNEILGSIKENVDLMNWHSEVVKWWDNSSYTSAIANVLWHFKSFGEQFVLDYERPGGYHYGKIGSEETLRVFSRWNEAVTWVHRCDSEEGSVWYHLEDGYREFIYHSGLEARQAVCRYCDQLMPMVWAPLTKFVCSRPSCQKLDQGLLVEVE